MLETISQIGIFVFGVSSAILIARKSKWGIVCGLLSQPFWMMTSIYHNQWGVMMINVIYTVTWLYAAYNWFKKDKNKNVI
jgi:hypothetical protein